MTVLHAPMRLLLQGNSAIATFSADDVKELPAGDFDVVIVTQAGERRCKVSAKDRTKILE